MSSSRSRSGLTCDVSSSSSSTIDFSNSKMSPSLPSKVYDCRSSLVLLQDFLQAGVLEIQGGDGRLAYCFFQIKDIVTSVDTKVNVGDKVRCNAWLLDESAKIPYLVSNLWCENQSVTDNSSVRDRILGMPEVEDLQVYHKLSKDLAWKLPNNRGVPRDYSDSSQDRSREDDGHSRYDEHDRRKDKERVSGRHGDDYRDRYKDRSSSRYENDRYRDNYHGRDRDVRVKDEHEKKRERVINEYDRKRDRHRHRSRSREDKDLKYRHVERLSPKREKSRDRERRDRERRDIGRDSYRDKRSRSRDRDRRDSSREYGYKHEDKRSHHDKERSFHQDDHYRKESHYGDGDSQRKHKYEEEKEDSRPSVPRTYDLKNVAIFKVGSGSSKKPEESQEPESNFPGLGYTGVGGPRDDDDDGGGGGFQFRGRGRGRGRGFRGRGRGRGRGQFVNTRGGAAPKKKLAIGRNVFCESDEEEVEEENMKQEVMQEKKVFHKVTDNRSGFGFKPKPKENVGNNRFKRWQELSRKNGDEDDLDEIAKFPSPERENSPISDTEIDFGSSTTGYVKEETPRPTSKLSNISASGMISYPLQQHQVPQHDGIRVLVKTYENEEVGILTGANGLIILFHINQVWINHPSIGFCNFKEIYPRSELSNQLYPGRSVLCWARSVTSIRHQVTHQATVVWCEAQPPAEAVWKSPDLVLELDTHLAELEAGRLARLDVVRLAATAKLTSVEGVVQEWISHEVGVVRLDSGGVALFHIGQVWAYKSSWIPYTSVMTKPASIDYLALGTTVLMCVRSLAASENNELRYQAMIIWNKNVCRAEEERSVGGGGMFSRRLIEAGDLPLSWLQEMASDQARTRLVSDLDRTWDTYKRLSKFEMKSVWPVAAILNLLPEQWQARIVKMVDLENGVICIQHKMGQDMSGELELGVTKIYCIFHLDDVYSVTGDKYRTGPDTNTLAPLLNTPVDLTARYIVSDGGHSIASMYHKAASLCLLSQTSTKPICCPILQAVCVFLKTCDSSAPVTLFAPRATKLRSVPESVHVEEPSTSFYLSYLLPLQLDVKAINFFSATNQAKLQKEVNNGLAMAYFKSSKRDQNGDRAEQQKYVDEMSSLDHHNAKLLVYGSYQPLNNNPLYNTFQPPKTLSGKSVQVQLLYQQGCDVKEGVVKFEVDYAGGPKISHYAFFDMSCYKFSLKTELRQRDLSTVIPIYGNQVLKAHIVLANASSPISYICTSLWNCKTWTRDPDPEYFHKLGNSIPAMDKLFMEKYERIVSSIVSSSQQASLSSAAASLLSILPSPIPASSQPPVSRWANAELIRNKVGRVTNIIDGNYGIAVVRIRSRDQPHVRERAIVLFDTCDVWVGTKTAQQLDMSLGQVMVEGDHVKIRAILVPESENRKNIRYLATSLVSAKSRAIVTSMKLPVQETLDNIDQIHPSKINNFYTVVSAVCHNIPGDGEEECRGVSTDEDDIPEIPDTSRPPPSLIVRQETPASKLSSAAAVSLDAYESEKEKRKLAKQNECLQQRRKLGYDKAAKEQLLMELKLKNQLLWKCSECNITCGKTGMEKHVTSKMHWDKVLDNFNKSLDAEQPPINR